MTWLVRILVVLALMAHGAAADVPDKGEPPEGDAEDMSLEEISRMLDNPLGNLWIIFMENDLGRYRGKPARNSEWVNTGLIQPVLPVPLTDDWNLVTRPIIPIVTAPRFNVSARDFGDCPGNCGSGIPPFSVGSDRTTALGDIVVWSMLSPNEPPELPDGSKMVWGAGPSFRFPTATEDKFGSERWSAGPSGILLRQPPKDGHWTLGLFGQHHWSFAGSSGRDSVSHTQLQYIWWYKLPVEGEWSVGAFPMIDINWKADGGNKYNVPIGLGFSTTFFVGPMPLRVGAEIDYFVAHNNDYGPRYMLKFFIVPVIPRLVKEPLFGRR
jgi:hypothetical protein